LTSLSGNTAVTRIVLKDHLGSMVAEVVILGTPGAAALGGVTLHGFGPWGNATTPLNVDQRGFTGHEHLAELGIIHMNGRLYDPVLGRFLQADPIIQAPHNAQSHNRYSYVMNNPLSFTDPTGFSSWTKFRDKWLKPIVALVAAIATYGAASEFLLAQLSEFALSGGTSVLTLAGGEAGIGISSVGFGAVGAASGAAAGFAAGGIMGGNIQSALQGAFSGAITGGIDGGFLRASAAVKFAARIAGSAAAARATGQDWRRAVKFAFVMSTLRVAGLEMRRQMVEQSRINPDNISGESYGVDGSGEKLAGARRAVNPETGRYFPCDPLMGGCQGAPTREGDIRSSFFGMEYAPRSLPDRINEGFAGPHDWLRNLTGSYINTVVEPTDVVGNSRVFTGARLWFDDYPMNYGLVIPASVFAIGILTPSGAYGALSATDRRR